MEDGIIIIFDISLSEKDIDLKGKLFQHTGGID
jgi:hypothetical protein